MWHGFCLPITLWEWAFLKLFHTFLFSFCHSFCLECLFHCPVPPSTWLIYTKYSAWGSPSFRNPSPIFHLVKSHPMSFHQTLLFWFGTLLFVYVCSQTVCCSRAESVSCPLFPPDKEDFAHSRCFEQTPKNDHPNLQVNQLRGFR